MLPLWLSSWYQYQQAQSQQPFNDQYIEAAADEEGDWVEVITPSIKSSNRRQPPQVQPHQKTSEVVEATSPPTPAADIMIKIGNKSSSSASTTVTPFPTVVTTTTAAEPVVKGLSRQERRAHARFAVREKKKQARNAAMVLNRSRVSVA
jgi:hypothetical protein